MVAYIPSPKHGNIHIGPLQLHMYGLMLAFGILAAASIARRRWDKWFPGSNTISEIAIPVVVGGVVGARVYHLFTGYDWEAGGIKGAFEIWNGGLSIWGVLAGGVLAVIIMARVKHVTFLVLADAIAPGLLAAQAIGRWGNWFNQELFGRPSKLPWALEIDSSHRPAKYLADKTFHPTFLYESLWCLLALAVLLWAERRFRFRRGQTFALYLALYTFGRIFFEALRADPASKLWGVRFNLLLSVVLCVGSAIWFVVLGRTQPVAPSSSPAVDTPPDDEASPRGDAGEPAEA